MENHLPLFAIPFYFLRHGETESNRLRLIAGTLDVRLNETGIGQARAAVERLRPLGITHVVSSALSRARETAEIVAAALALPHSVVPEIGERHWGILQGRPQSERLPGAQPEGAETREAFVARTRSGLARIEARGAPLIVAHSGTFRALCHLLALEEPAQAVANCHPLRLEPPAQGDGRWTVRIV